MWLFKKNHNDNTCKLHGVTLQEGEAKIHYGLTRFSRDYLKAKAQLFPNSNSLLVGGCYVSETFPKTGLVRFCPRCRDAQRRWEEKHNKQ